MGGGGVKTYKQTNKTVIFLGFMKIIVVLLQKKQGAARYW